MSSDSTSKTRTAGLNPGNRESVSLNNFTLKSMADSAGKQFDKMDVRLGNIEERFETKLGGKTIVGQIFTLLGILLWIAAFAAAFIFGREIIPGTASNNIIMIVAAVVLLVLFGFMATETLINFSYCESVTSYKRSISALREKLRVGKASIKSNHDAFMASKEKGWNHALNAQPSIPDEATSIETTMSNMESLKGGFLHIAKNILYFASVVVFTIAGCVLLFETGAEIMSGISHTSLSDGVTTTFDVIAMIAVCVGNIILSKLLWSKTDCTVTPLTLFTLPLGPIAFLLLIALGTLLVLLLAAVVSIVLAILGIVVVGGIVFACLCGG